MKHDPDALAPWIAELHRRIEQRELTVIPQVHLDEGSRVDADLIARIMLAEFDALEVLPPEEQETLENVVKRRSLLWDLLWLREQIG